MSKYDEVIAELEEAAKIVDHPTAVGDEVPPLVWEDLHWRLTVRKTDRQGVTFLEYLRQHQDYDDWDPHCPAWYVSRWEGFDA